MTPDNKKWFAVGLILVAILAVFFSYRSLPRNESPKPANNAERTNWIRQKAMEAQGDFYKLSPEDQQKVTQIMGGRAVDGLRMMYERPPKP